MFMVDCTFLSPAGGAWGDKVESGHRVTLPAAHTDGMSVPQETEGKAQGGLFRPGRVVGKVATS